MTTEATIEVRLEKVVEAIQARMWLDGTYQAEYSKEKNAGPIRRQILPFRVYRSREGDLVVDGFDTYRATVRTFRLDRFLRLAKGERHEGDDPAVLATRKGEIPIYPVDWSLVQARPQKVSEQALDKFLSRGWSLTPYAGVVEPPRVH